MTRTFQDELDEARTAQNAGEIGRARTCARRAVGKIMQEKIGIGPAPSDYASTYIDGLRRLASDLRSPVSVREAAARLVDRSNKEYISASVDPVHDAEILLAFFVNQRGNDHERLEKL